MRIYKFFIFSFLFLAFGCSETPNNNGGSTTTVIPIAPSNLTGTVLSSTQVNLSWTDNSTNETGYKIERRLDGGNYNLIGTVNTDITNYNDQTLSPRTNYTFRVYSYNSVGNSITYSNEFSVSTGGVPVLSTSPVISITMTNSVSGGNITDEGGSSITARGIVWSTTPNPTTALQTKTTDGTGIGTFTSNLTGLSVNTTYYVRAYATNSNGTGYGNEQTFSTLNYSLPTLTTSAISSLGANSAISGGEVSNDGGVSVTARGVVWSTTSNPTVTLTTKTVNGSGLGLFTSNLTNLSPTTTYFVRAYATNSMGTAYGNEIGFITSVLPYIYTYTQGPNVSDIDGNSYSSFTTMCGETWTNSNLNVTRYRNGDVIPQVTDSLTWANLTTGAWCYYNNNPTNGTIYGKMYNWYAINDPRGIAPQGWHVPTIGEWNKLLKCIDITADTISLPGGGYSGVQSSTGGGAMKEAGLTHWSSPNTGATNNSGFIGLPGGMREYSLGFFVAISTDGFFWINSTPNDVSYAFVGTLNSNNAAVGVSQSIKKAGTSVRCVKD